MIVKCANNIVFVQKSLIYHRSKPFFLDYSLAKTLKFIILALGFN